MKKLRSGKHNPNKLGEKYGKVAENHGLEFTSPYQLTMISALEQGTFRRYK